MTFVTQDQTRRHSLNLLIAENVYRLMQRIGDYRSYRSTVAALADLNDAQLADMGVHRSEIKRIAIEAVYGSEA